MPGTIAAMAAERDYAASLEVIRRRISQQLSRLTIDLDADDLVAAIEAFVPVAARLVASGQLEAQQAAAGFVASFLEAEGEAAARRTVAAEVAGVNSDDVPLVRLLRASLGNGVFNMLRSGHSASEAVRYAAHAVSRLADAEVAAAADREVAHQGEDDRKVEGWMWVLTGGENCAACLARADGRLRSMDEPFPRHPHCDCIRSIRLTNDPQTLEHPTGEELFNQMSPERQARQFRTAGAEKAEMVRNGTLTLAEMVEVERHSGWRTIVTEKPLADVTP